MKVAAMSPDPLLLTAIVGNVSDATMAGRLHELSHDGRLEILEIAEQDAPRRRLRANTDKGTDCAVALPRDQRLSDGDVLLLEAGRAIVVRLGRADWLRLTPRDADAALRLGYHAGNLHWRVRFDGADLLVALELPRQNYLDRLAEFVAAGDVEVAP